MAGTATNSPVAPDVPAPNGLTASGAHPTGTVPIPFIPPAREPLRHATALRAGAAAGPPVAAVRVPRRVLGDIRSALRGAGFGVLDILTQDIGPTPSVLVLDLPEDTEAAARLLGAGRAGPGRVLLVSDRGRVAGVALRLGHDEVIDVPCHPLQVAAAALRVSGGSPEELAQWATSVFAELPAR